MFSGAWALSLFMFSIAYSIVAGAQCAYSQILAAQEQEERYLSSMSPEMKAKFLQRKAEHQAQLQKIQNDRIAYNKARNGLLLAEKGKRLIEERTHRYEQESRAAYPHAWMLSDWVDELKIILDEEGSYNPIPRLTNSEN